MRMEGLPTARGETRERSPTNPWSPVSSSGGNPDGPERRRRRPAVQIEGQTTQEEFSSSGNPGISSHRGPGTVPARSKTLLKCQKHDQKRHATMQVKIKSQLRSKNLSENSSQKT